MLKDVAIKLGRFFYPLLRNKAGLLGLTLIVALMLISFVGPLLVSPETISHPDQINQPPSMAYPLGTDADGRQNWIMFVHGGRDVLMAAFLTGLLTTLIAVTVGAISAFLGGLTDQLLMFITDIWLTLPTFLLLIVLATIVELKDVFTLSICLSTIGWPMLARQVRAQFLSLKQREYVEAAQLLDLGTPYIIFHELLPGMMSYIVLAMIGAMISAIYTQTALVFLGLVPFGNNWGVMFSMAYNRNAMYNPNSLASMLVPMSGIALFQLGLVLFSRMLEEVFNPRLRQNR